MTIFSWPLHAVKFHNSSGWSFRLIQVCSSQFWFRSGVWFCPWLHEIERTRWSLHSFFEPWKVAAFTCSVTKWTANFYCHRIIETFNGIYRTLCFFLSLYISDYGFYFYYGRADDFQLGMGLFYIQLCVENELCHALRSLRFDLRHKSELIS